MQIDMFIALMSHAHQVPHIGLPHTLPVTNANKVKAAPMGADTFATI
jgi:hypothetical protein